MKVLELKEYGKWWFAVIKPEESFVSRSFESEVTMLSDDDTPTFHHWRAKCTELTKVGQTQTPATPKV